MELSQRTHRIALMVVVLLGLAVRVLWVSSRPVDEAAMQALPDQQEYLTLGRHLLEGQGLVFYDDRFRANVYAYRMPLYPAFVAACGANVRVVLVVQALIDAMTIIGVTALAMAVLPAPSRRLGSVLTAVLVAFNPFLIYFCGLVLSETLFTAMMMWGMVLLLVGGRGGRWVIGGEADNNIRPWTGTGLWLGGGLLLAASTLVRPSAAPLALVLGIAATFAQRGFVPAGASVFRPRWPLPVATTMLLLTVAVLTPWAYRNKQVVGTWVWTTTNSGVTAYDGFNPDATGASDQTVLKALPHLASMNEVDRSTYLSSLAQDFIRRQPRRAAELAVAKGLRTWSPIPLSADYGGWTYKLAGGGYSVPLYLLTLIGIWAAPIPRSVKAFLLAPALYFTFVHMASVGSLRYRVPVEPALAVLAGAGAAFLLCSRPGWRRAGSPDAD